MRLYKKCGDCVWRYVQHHRDKPKCSLHESTSLHLWQFYGFTFESRFHQLVTEQEYDQNLLQFTTSSSFTSDTKMRSSTVDKILFQLSLIRYGFPDWIDQYGHSLEHFIDVSKTTSRKLLGKICWVRTRQTLVYFGGVSFLVGTFVKGVCIKYLCGRVLFIHQEHFGGPFDGVSFSSIVFIGRFRFGGFSFEIFCY